VTACDAEAARVDHGAAASANDAVSATVKRLNAAPSVVALIEPESVVAQWLSG